MTPIDLPLLRAVEWGGVRKCAFTDLFVLFDALYSSSVGGETRLTRRVSFCLWANFVRDVGVWVA